MNAADPAAFAAYIDAFNRDDYRAFGDYYAEDVVLVIAGLQTLQGRQAIFDYYRRVKAQTRRTIDIIQSFSDGDGLAAELQSEFLALDDAPDFLTGPLRAGDRIRIHTFVLYELSGGRYSRIRSATFRRTFIPAAASFVQGDTP